MFGCRQREYLQVHCYNIKFKKKKNCFVWQHTKINKESKQLVMLPNLVTLLENITNLNLFQRVNNEEEFGTETRWIWSKPIVCSRWSHYHWTLPTKNFPSMDRARKSRSHYPNARGQLFVQAHLCNKVPELVINIVPSFWGKSVWCALHWLHVCLFQQCRVTVPFCCG